MIDSEIGINADNKWVGRGISAGRANDVLNDPLMLWEHVTHRRDSEDLSWVIPVQIGLITESFNAAYYTHMTGREITHRNVKLQHPQYPWLRCELDGITRTSDGDLAYVDCKHVGRAGDQLTIRYTAQCTHSVIVWNACSPHHRIEHWCLSTLIGNSRWELTEQEIDPFFAVEYLARARELWACCEADATPDHLVEPIAVPAPRSPLRVVQLDDSFRSEWPNWGLDCVDQFNIFARTLGAHQAHEISKRTIKELMPDDVGEIRRGAIKAVRDKVGAVRVSIKAGAQAPGSKDPS